MTATSFELERCDGKRMHCLRWSPDGAVRGVVQIAHGMAEYAARYDGVARALVDAGYAVYAGDHRGHGGSVREDADLGRLGPAGWKGVLCDLHVLSDTIRATHPAQPLFLLGHSWGSMLGQAYAQQWGSELKGLILSGSNGADPLVAPGVLLARLVVACRGADRQAVLLDKLSVGSLNKAFEPGATGKEWLSRDPEEVRRYVDDPRCGFPCPNSFFLELLRLLHATWKRSAEARIPRDLPVLTITGTADPVSRGGRGIRALAARYRGLGLADVTERYYESARHEVFNDPARDEAIRDLIVWLDAHR
jgi:alpha-beta hydrolase superfamily lysophospholipase